MDAVFELQDSATYSVGILAAPSGDFELVEWGTVQNIKDRLPVLQARGLVFAGAIGMVEGVARIALDVPLPESTLTTVAQAFISLVEERANQQLAVNSPDVQWLESLYKLEDPRPCQHGEVS